MNAVEEYHYQILLMKKIFFLFQLVKAKRSGTLSEYLRDFLVIFLGLLMTAGILFIAIRLIPRIFF